MTSCCFLSNSTFLQINIKDKVYEGDNSLLTDKAEEAPPAEETDAQPEKRAAEEEEEEEVCELLYIVCLFFCL